MKFLSKFVATILMLSMTTMTFASSTTKNDDGAGSYVVYDIHPSYTNTTLNGRWEYWDYPDAKGVTVNAGDLSKMDGQNGNARFLDTPGGSTVYPTASSPQVYVAQYTGAGSAGGWTTTLSNGTNQWGTINDFYTPPADPPAGLAYLWYPYGFSPTPQLYKGQEFTDAGNDAYNGYNKNVNVRITLAPSSTAKMGTYNAWDSMNKLTQQQWALQQEGDLSAMPYVYKDASTPNTPQMGWNNNAYGKLALSMLGNPINGGIAAALNFLPPDQRETLQQVFDGYKMVSSTVIRDASMGKFFPGLISRVSGAYQGNMADLAIVTNNSAYSNSVNAWDKVNSYDVEAQIAQEQQLSAIKNNDLVEANYWARELSSATQNKAAQVTVAEAADTALAAETAVAIDIVKAATEFLGEANVLFQLAMTIDQLVVMSEVWTAEQVTNITGGQQISQQAVNVTNMKLDSSFTGNSQGDIQIHSMNSQNLNANINAGAYDVNTTHRFVMMDNSNIDTFAVNPIVDTNNTVRDANNNATALNSVYILNGSRVNTFINNAGSDMHGQLFTDSSKNAIDAGMIGVPSDYATLYSDKWSYANKQATDAYAIIVGNGSTVGTLENYGRISGAGILVGGPSQTVTRDTGFTPGIPLFTSTGGIATITTTGNDAFITSLNNANYISQIIVTGKDGFNYIPDKTQNTAGELARGWSEIYGSPCNGCSGGTSALTDPTPEIQFLINSGSIDQIVNGGNIGTLLNGGDIKYLVNYNYIGVLDNHTGTIETVDNYGVIGSYSSAISTNTAAYGQFNNYGIIRDYANYGPVGALIGSDGIANGRFDWANSPFALRTMDNYASIGSLYGDGKVLYNGYNNSHIGTIDGVFGISLSQTSAGLQYNNADYVNTENTTNRIHLSGYASIGTLENHSDINLTVTTVTDSNNNVLAPAWATIGLFNNYGTVNNIYYDGNMNLHNEIGGSINVYYPAPSGGGVLYDMSSHINAVGSVMNEGTIALPTLTYDGGIANINDPTNSFFVNKGTLTTDNLNLSNYNVIQLGDNLKNIHNQQTAVNVSGVVKNFDTGANNQVALSVDSTPYTVSTGRTVNGYMDNLIIGTGSTVTTSSTDGNTPTINAGNFIANGGSHLANTNIVAFDQFSNYGTLDNVNVTLTGTDSTNGYAYLGGIINGNITLGQKNGDALGQIIVPQNSTMPGVTMSMANANVSVADLEVGTGASYTGVQATVNLRTDGATTPVLFTNVNNTGKLTVNGNSSTPVTIGSLYNAGSDVYAGGAVYNQTGGVTTTVTTQLTNASNAVINGNIVAGTGSNVYDYGIINGDLTLNDVTKANIGGVITGHTYLSGTKSGIIQIGGTNNGAVGGFVLDALNSTSMTMSEFDIINSGSQATLNVSNAGVATASTIGTINNSGGNLTINSKSLTSTNINNTGTLTVNSDTHSSDVVNAGTMTSANIYAYNTSGVAPVLDTTTNLYDKGVYNGGTINGNVLTSASTFVQSSGSTVNGNVTATNATDFQNYGSINGAVTASLNDNQSYNIGDVTGNASVTAVTGATNTIIDVGTVGGILNVKGDVNYLNLNGVVTGNTNIYNKTYGINIASGANLVLASGSSVNRIYNSVDATSSITAADATSGFIYLVTNDGTLTNKSKYVTIRDFANTGTFNGNVTLDQTAGNTSVADLGGTVNGNIVFGSNTGLTVQSGFMNNGSDTLTINNDGTHNFGYIDNGGKIAYNGSLNNIAGYSARVDTTKNTVGSIDIGNSTGVLPFNGISNVSDMVAKGAGYSISGALVTSNGQSLTADQFASHIGGSTSGTKNYGMGTMTWGINTDGTGSTTTTVTNPAPKLGMMMASAPSSSGTSSAPALGASAPVVAAAPALMFAYSMPTAVHVGSDARSTISNSTSTVATIINMNSVNSIVGQRADQTINERNGSDLNAVDGVWAKAYGNWGGQRDVGSQSGFGLAGGGVAFGADADIGGGNTVGVFGATSYGTAKGNDRSNPSSVSMSDYTVGVYGTKRLEDREFIDYQADFTIGGNNTSRTIGDQGTTATGQYQSTAEHASIGIRKEFDLNDTTIITPSVKLDYTHFNTRGYDETGAANALNASVAGQSYDRLLPYVGVRMDHLVTEHLHFIADENIGYNVLHSQLVNTANVDGVNLVGVSPVQVGNFVSDTGVGLAYDVDPATTIGVRYDYQTTSGGFHNNIGSVTYRHVF